MTMHSNVVRIACPTILPCTRHLLNSDNLLADSEGFVRRQLGVFSHIRRAFKAMFAPNRGLIAVYRHATPPMDLFRINVGPRVSLRERRSDHWVFDILTDDEGYVMPIDSDERSDYRGKNIPAENLFFQY